LSNGYIALEGTGEHISSGDKLIMLIQVLTRATNRVFADRWQHRGSTVSDAIAEVLAAAADLEPTVIRPPSQATPAHILSSAKFFPYFRDCIAALDGTFCVSKLPWDQNRKAPEQWHKKRQAPNAYCVIGSAIAEFGDDKNRITSRKLDVPNAPQYCPLWHIDIVAIKRREIGNIDVPNEA
jgi:hypothetical protein